MNGIDPAMQSTKENIVPEQIQTRDAGYYVYGFILGMLVLTGFAQMPIFKRYYIADIPGLAWLGNFYATHWMHYLFAALLIGYTTFLATTHLLSKGKWRSIQAAAGSMHFWILSGLILTGGLLVVRNLPNMHFPATFIILIDLSHLTLVMVFLVHSGFRFFFRRR